MFQLTSFQVLQVYYKNLKLMTFIPSSFWYKEKYKKQIPLKTIINGEKSNVFAKISTYQMDF